MQAWDVVLNRKRAFGRINYEGTTKARFQRVVMELEIKVNHQPTKTIDLEPAEHYFDLSVSAEIGESCWTSAFDDIRRLYPLCQPKRADQADLLRICELGERFRNNNTQSGTRFQQAILEGAKAQFTLAKVPDKKAWTGFNTSYKKDDEYEWARHILTQAGYLTDRGHEYGHAWLVEIVPWPVLKELAQLFRCSPAEKLSLVNWHYKLGGVEDILQVVS